MHKVNQVLVADDDSTMRELLSLLLKDDGYQVTTAQSGEQCLFLALEVNFDAFLIDINMPSLNGLEVCYRLRNMDQFKMVPIIFISVKNEDTNFDTIFPAGATDFISKPINPSILKARLKAHLERVQYFDEAEKNRYFLSRFLPRRTRRMVEAYSLTGALPKPERHNVSVMFTDIRDFTRTTHDVDLDSLFSWLSECLGEQVKLVHRYGGYVDKFTGDGIMAIFDRSDSAVRACYCALQIVKMCRQYLHMDGTGLGLPIGIGIHYGPVLIGNIGSGEHLEYSALGQAVNIASRLCSQAESMHIDVSDIIASMAKQDVRLKFGVPNTVNIKGVAEEVLVYSVTEEQ